MPEPTAHSAAVDQWLERTGDDLSADQWLRLFQAAFDTLWRRTVVTLGDVTLNAIVRRVLCHAADRYPALAALRAESSGLEWEQLYEAAETLDKAQLREGLRFILVEFLSVLGSLTAEILSRELHAELSEVSLPPKSNQGEDSQP